eukprot:scaffold61175_cov38-Attheya_sp.AAC.2
MNTGRRAPALRNEPPFLTHRRWSKKGCQQKWAEIAPVLQCKLYEAIVENPRASSDNNRRRQNKNKWFTKEHHENLESKEENWKEHKKAIYICDMCMSDKWEILEPTKWSRTVIKTEILSTQSDRVWRRKIDGKMKVYHETVDKHLETAENHIKAIRSTLEHNRKLSMDLLKTSQLQRLKVLIEKQLKQLNNTQEKHKPPPKRERKQKKIKTIHNP